MKPTPIPPLKGRMKRDAMRAAAAADMQTHKQRGDAALLRNLRKHMPHAKIPQEDPKRVAPEPKALWWPLWNPWALAVDQALVAAGLAPTVEGANPDEALSRLIASHVDDAVRAVERDAQMRASEMAV